MLGFFRSASRVPASSERTAPISSVTILGREVEVRRRAYRRSIGLTLHVNGKVKVSAPKSTPLSAIVKFVEAQADWITGHLSKYESLRSQFPPKLITEGERFPYLGRELILEFEPASVRQPGLRVVDARLVLEIPRAQWEGFDTRQAHPELRPLIARFYRERGTEWLTMRLRHFSDRTGLRPTAISFRSQKTRWGSCSSRGRISLNWRLIVAPLEVIDYVVMHELSHLEVYNHSAKFWSLVATQIPEYRQHRRWLQTNAYAGDFLSPRSELYG